MDTERLITHKTLITNRNKTSEIINTIKQKITDTERDELEKYFT